MGSARRLGWNALILVIAALVGIVVGDALATALGGEVPPVPHLPATATPGSSQATQASAPRVAPISKRVLALAVDGRVRIDGGRPLGDPAAIAEALRGEDAGEVIVVPHADVPWEAIVDFVDLVRRVVAERGRVCTVRLDAPPE